MYLTPVITMETPPKGTSDLGVSWGGLLSPLQLRGFRQPTCLEILRTRRGALTKVVGKCFLRRDSENLRTEEEESWRVADPSKSLPDAGIPSATSQQVSRSYLRSPVTLPPPGYLGLGVKQDHLIAWVISTSAINRKAPLCYRVTAVEGTSDLVSM